MGKYEPLTEFLQKQPGGVVRMSFAQIERVVGFKLPPVAQRHRAWWSNSPTNNVMTRAWLDAGFCRPCLRPRSGGAGFSFGPLRS